MSRPARIPERGDVAPGVIAQLLGIPLPDFDAVRPQLEHRGFPSPDPTTGRYCIEAVDRWRLRRHHRLFPELHSATEAVHADIVFADRLRRMSEA